MEVKAAFYSLARLAAFQSFHDDVEIADFFSHAKMSVTQYHEFVARVEDGSSLE